MLTDSKFFMATIAFLLGIRHGFDLDHLATIDSITRAINPQRFLAKISGFLFSLGHGLVVILISLIIGGGYKPNSIPKWLNSLGNGISITFLLLFGILNLWSVFQSPTKSASSSNIKSYLIKKLIGEKLNPFIVVLIGTLFALSFDTVSQVVLFSLTATALAGCFFSGLLGLVFMIGMIMADGLNGLLVSALIQYANKKSLLLARITGLLIASFSLIIGIINFYTI